MLTDKEAELYGDYLTILSDISFDFVKKHEEELGDSATSGMVVAGSLRFAVMTCVAYGLTEVKIHEAINSLCSTMNEEKEKWNKS